MTSVALGTHHACVIDALGNAFGWGCGASGQLGDGNQGSSCKDAFGAAPAKVEGLSVATSSKP